MTSSAGKTAKIELLFWKSGSQENLPEGISRIAISANLKIKNTYHKASLEALFQQIWKSRKLGKPHKAPLELQFL